MPILETKKRKVDSNKDGDEEEEDNDDEEPHPMEVLVDTILSTLAKPSALGKSICEFVFKSFSGRLTAGAVELLFDVGSCITLRGGFSCVLLFIF